MVARTLLVGRYAIAGGSALVVVFGLFWLMQYLINIADRELDKDDPGRMLEVCPDQPGRGGQPAQTAAEKNRRPRTSRPRSRRRLPWIT